MGEREVIFMFAFSIVRKIGEGNYLNDDRFTIERVRKTRALNSARFGRTRAGGWGSRGLSKNDRFWLS